MDFVSRIDPCLSEDLLVPERRTSASLRNPVSVPSLSHLAVTCRLLIRSILSCRVDQTVWRNCRLCSRCQGAGSLRHAVARLRCIPRKDYECNIVLYGTCHLDELFPTRCFCSKPMNSLSLADERVRVEFFDDRADWLRSQRKLLSASPSFKLPRGQTAIGQDWAP